MGANVIDFEEVFSAIALSSEDVVDFVGKARNSANCKVRVIESVDATLLTDSSDQVETGLADALSVD